MTTLATTKTWRRDLAARLDCSPDLTPEEHANVRAALRFLRTRLGGGHQLAAALGVNVAMVKRATTARRKPTAGLAIRAARLAGTPMDRVLAGEFPAQNVCPRCEKSD